MYPAKSPRRLDVIPVTLVRSMSRLLLSMLTLSSLTLVAFADPIKKGPDADKLAKECVEGFIKAALEGKADEAIKFFSTPYRHHDGSRHVSLDILMKVFKHPPPADAEGKVGKISELSKINEYLKANSRPQLDADTIKEFETYMSTEGRIVELVSNVGGGPERSEYALVRVKDGKAHIVGVFHRNK